MGSSKRVIDNAEYVKVGDDGADLAVNFFFPAIEVLHLDKVSFDVRWTGTPDGTFDVQVSNKGDDWSTIDSNVRPGGSAGYGYVEKDVGSKYVRLSYTSNSGSGTLKVHVVAKSNS